MGTKTAHHLKVWFVSHLYALHLLVLIREIKCTFYLGISPSVGPIAHRSKACRASTPAHIDTGGYYVARRL